MHLSVNLRLRFYDDMARDHMVTLKRLLSCLMMHSLDQ